MGTEDRNITSEVEAVLQQYVRPARPARSSWARDNPLPQVFFT